MRWPGAANSSTLVRGLCFVTPLPTHPHTSGHNLESTWLVAVTLDYLLELDAIPADVARRYRATVMSIGAAAIRDGYDAQHGGVYESGSALEGPTGPGSSLVKVWWIQAESMLALWKLHEYFNIDAAPAASNDDDGSGEADADSVDYLHVLARTVRFVRDHQTDGSGSGEQFWQVSQLDG
jgi:hypothetical protein